VTVQSKAIHAAAHYLEYLDDPKTFDVFDVNPNVAMNRAVEMYYLQHSIPSKEFIEVSSCVEVDSDLAGFFGVGSISDFYNHAQFYVER